MSLFGSNGYVITDKEIGSKCPYIAYPDPYDAVIKYQNGLIYHDNYELCIVENSYVIYKYNTSKILIKWALNYVQRVIPIIQKYSNDQRPIEALYYARSWIYNKNYPIDYLRQIIILKGLNEYAMNIRQEPNIGGFRIAVWSVVSIIQAACDMDIPIQRRVYRDIFRAIDDATMALYYDAPRGRARIGSNYIQIEWSRKNLSKVINFYNLELLAQSKYNITRNFLNFKNLDQKKKNNKKPQNIGELPDDMLVKIAGYI